MARQTQSMSHLVERAAELVTNNVVANLNVWESIIRTSESSLVVTLNG